MRFAKHLFTRSLLALVVGVGLGAAGLVVGASPASAAKNVNQTTDQFRTGGCSGCFFTQTEAIVANFQTVTRVFRGCITGANVNPGQFSSDECGGAADIGGKSALLDFFVIQGDLKDSNTSSDGLGVPGGATDVTYRVSSTGSSRGLRCANGGTDPNTNSLGFLAPEGLDGVPGTSDDAGVGPGFAVLGVPTGWGNNASTKRAALVSCPTTATGGTHIADFAAGLSNPPNFSGMQELCVVNYDQDGNADISNKADGVLPGSYSSIANALGTTNETTNLRLTCDSGFADLPPQDFQSSSFNTQSFANQGTFGAQIFKIIVSNDVYPASDPGPSGTTKIALQMPQVQGLFGGTSLAVDACSWKAVGGAVNGDPAGGITTCFRENGSGSRETFRNTFMREPEGSHPQGSTVGTFTCNARSEGGGGSGTPKTFIQNNTNSDEAGCVAGNTGAVGYVNAGRASAGNFHAIPVYGIDPDTNNLRTMVKCGLWPYWGPLSGGTGIHAGGTPLSNPFVAAHFSNLRNGAIFSAGEDYLPLGGLDTGVAFDKPLTAGAYKVKFTAASCPGTFNAPSAHP